MNQIEKLISRYPLLECCKHDIQLTFEILRESYKAKCKLLVCGNGGSAADAEHIVGELMKGFKNSRKCDEEMTRRLKAVDVKMGAVLADNLQGALPAIALDGHIALSTAYMNDCAPLLCFAQQVTAMDVVAMCCWQFQLRVTVKMFFMRRLLPRRRG